MCGSAVIVLSKGHIFQLAGILLGGGKGNHNLVLTCNHPAFVALYVQYVLPDISFDTHKEKIRLWLVHNFETIRKLSKFALNEEWKNYLKEPYKK